MRSGLIGALAGLLLLAPAWGQQTPAQPGPEAVAPAIVAPQGAVADWRFWPDFGLQPAASGISGPQARPGVAVPLAPARRWHGAMPTERLTDLLDPAGLPAGPFTVSMWVSYHVNHPVGAAVIAASPDARAPAWAFGFEHGDVTFAAGGASLTRPAIEVKGSTHGQDPASGPYRRGAQRYWHLLTAVHDGRMLRIYHNGLEVGTTPAGRMERAAASTQVEIAAYLEQEPHMRLANLVQAVTLHDRALSPAEIAADFAARTSGLDYGAPHPGRLHFSSGGPLLQAARPGVTRLLWETDRPTSALLEWGPTPALGQSMQLAADGSRVRQAEIPGLAGDQVFHYQLTVEAGGQRISSGPHAARTAPPAGAPVVFAAISDTEARPHVNAHLARLMFGESPQFVLNVGDLTDGGKRLQRAEWTHEYLPAMAGLMARVPVLPVMGNGEDDIVWYDRYHANDGPEPSYYPYRHGDVEVFVLDSNLDVRDQTDAGFRARQRAWLETALRASDARWKIAAFHHPALPERYAKVSADFMPALERAGVDLILVGHHHSYLRSWPQLGAAPVTGPAPIHVQLGNGGGNVSGRPPTTDPRWAASYQGFGYAIIRIHGAHLSFAMHDDRGALRDRFEIHKPEPR